MGLLSKIRVSFYTSYGYKSLFYFWGANFYFLPQTAFFKDFGIKWAPFLGTPIFFSDHIKKEHPMQILGRSLVEQSGLKQTKSERKRRKRRGRQ